MARRLRDGSKTHWPRLHAPGPDRRARLAHQDAPPTKPVGRWEHKLTKGGSVTLALEDGRLHLVMKGDSRLTLHADYAVTRDGVLYGVVTSAEAPDGPDTDEQDLMDEPFSILYRVDEGVLVVRDVRSSVLSKDETAMLIGRYEKNNPPPTAQTVQQTARRRPVGVAGTGVRRLTVPPSGAKAATRNGRVILPRYCAISRCRSRPRRCSFRIRIDYRSGLDTFTDV